MTDTQTQERPILFSGPMVRAILEGRKTQTRRPVKPQPKRYEASGGWGLTWHEKCGAGSDWLASYCPFGVPGDRLWVRETWAHYQTIDRRKRADGASFSEVSDGLAGYRADGFDDIKEFRSHIELMGDAEAVEINGDRWRPSIHMPRWACRLTLKVTDVRAERIQEMSSVDAIQEGVYAVSPRETYLPIQRFIPRWDAIYAKRGSGWDANPWVWVVSFEEEKAAK